ncbi:MAG TPA: aminoglycoside phosphotransferase family protein [Burkholderiales bacterium]
MSDAITQFLVRSGLGKPAHMQALSGGVSSDIWRAELAGGPVCVKRALARLRVAQVWEAPIERNRYERQWLQVAREALPSSAPKVLAWDDAGGLFAMECLEYPVWKSVLREGNADPAFASAVGTALGTIHASTAGRPAIAQRFSTDAIFHAIRLEPYLLATAARHPDLPVLKALQERTAASRLCLVHGDVSPKNILVGGKGPAQFPIFLDAECAWYGDPAFDVAFCLNHLLLKCLWVPHARNAFLQCFDALCSSYLERVSWEAPSLLEERTATLLPGLLLARVDGKSPVEYLDAAGQDFVRRTARRLLTLGAPKLDAVRKAWQESLT